jgi:nucleotide sugar dehydrogenase
MVYRDVNIALANELAAYAESLGLDFNAVIAAANTDGESALLAPGIDVGGQCASEYSYFALQGAAKRGLTLGLTAEARRINDHQAARLLDRVTGAGVALAGNKVLILGLGFRSEVKQQALSSAVLIQEESVRRGAHVMLHDPLYTPAEIESHHFVPFNVNADVWPPIVVLNTGHTEYANLDFTRLRELGVKVIVDGRRFWKPAKAHDAGLLYLAAGLSQTVELSLNGH